MILSRIKKYNKSQCDLLKYFYTCMRENFYYRVDLNHLKNIIKIQIYLEVYFTR